ncbi:MAG: helix-turn-helix domain-containing protein [Lachnospiraceae bacterium]|nr:helix-turn-helix domain-containing protein [Lachnospiraceae bacterium]
MAKGKYAKWLEDDNLLLLKGWARDGLTDDEIAKKMGVSRSTFYAWCEKYSDISDTIKKAREPVDVILEDTAFDRATKWKTVREVTKERRFNREKGEYEMAVTKEVEKTIPPDSTLLIFLMKARMREKYGDRQKLELSGQVDTGNPFAGLTEDQLRRLARGDG